jgi:hypothetical protein
MGNMRNAYKMLFRKAQGERPLGKPMQRWNNIKMDLREIGCEMKVWTGWKWFGTASFSK